MPLTFSYEALESAKTARKRLHKKVLELKEAKDKENKSKQEKYLNLFTSQVNEDLNTPQSLATMWEMLKDENLSNTDKYQLLLKFDEVLGLGLAHLKKEKIKIPAEVKKLAQEREQARKNKDWKKSDLLRDKIKALGYQVADTKEGYEITKI